MTRCPQPLWILLSFVIGEEVQDKKEKLPVRSEDHSSGHSLYHGIQKTEFIPAEVDGNTEGWSFFPKPLAPHKPQKIPSGDTRIPSSYVAISLSAQTISGLRPRMRMKVRCCHRSPAKMNHHERANQIGTHQNRSWLWVETQLYNQLLSDSLLTDMTLMTMNRCCWQPKALHLFSRTGNQ